MLCPPSHKHIHHPPPYKTFGILANPHLKQPTDGLTMMSLHHVTKEYVWLPYWLLFTWLPSGLSNRPPPPECIVYTVFIVRYILLHFFFPHRKRSLCFSESQIWCQVVTSMHKEFPPSDVCRNQPECRVQTRHKFDMICILFATVKIFPHPYLEAFKIVLSKHRVLEKGTGANGRLDQACPAFW